MKLAVMQPYIFPYIGYFQLIQQVDKFIFYDDVNFIKQGWINRNRILINGEPKFINIPCVKASSFKKILEIEHRLNEIEKQNFLKKIKVTYSKAPFFNETFELIEKCLTDPGKSIAELAIKSVTEISSYLNLNCEFIISSKRYSNQNLPRQERLIDICKQESCDTYVNPIGGNNLYSKDAFLNENISLLYFESEIKVYKQFKNEFVPSLSIIDVLMFVSKEEIIKTYLPNAKLI